MHGRMSMTKQVTSPRCYVAQCCAVFCASCLRLSLVTSANPPTNSPHNMPDTEVTSGEHPLQTPWTLYFDKKMQTKSGDLQKFEANLVKLGVCSSVESFWKHFSHMTPPDSLPHDTNYYMFRRDVIPAWETFPKGGAWILRVKKRNGIINRLWEELLFACIGECFAEPSLVGVVFSSRAKDDLVSVWIRDGIDNPDARLRIGEKLKSILNLDASTSMDYKPFSASLRDGSSFRHATTFAFVARDNAADAQ